MLKAKRRCRLEIVVTCTNAVLELCLTLSAASVECFLSRVPGAGCTEGADKMVTDCGRTAEKAAWPCIA